MLKHITHDPTGKSRLKLNSYTALAWKKSGSADITQNLHYINCFNYCTNNNFSSRTSVKTHYRHSKKDITGI